MDWTTRDREEILKLVEDHYKNDQDNKLSLVRTWEENIRFIDGDQYIRYNKKLYSYEPIPDRIDSQYVPKANDNQLYVRADILRSNITRQTPSFNITANSSDPKDEKYAKVALAIHDARTEYDMDDTINAKAADWAIDTGNAFIKTSWCPTATIPVIDENGNPVLDKKGNPVEAPLGDVKREAISPLKIAPDAHATGEDDLSVIMQYSLENLDDVKKWYSVSGPGYTGEAIKLEGEDLDGASILKINDDLKDYQNESIRGESYKKVILKEVYVKPNKVFKYGRMIVVANTRLLYSYDSPYGKCDDASVFHPYEHFCFKTNSGKYWGSTPITQLVKLQRRLNAIDTMIILNRQTNAFGQWLIPVNSIKSGAISGRPGLKINYKPGPRGEKPEKVYGMAVGADVYKEREDVIKSMDAICGTGDIMQGNAPQNAGSGITLEMLREIKFSRFNPMYLRWEKFLEGSARLRLLLISKKQSTNIPVFTQMIRTKLRDLTGLDIQSFVGKDISDNTNIRVVAGSSVPKSNAAKLSFLEKFGEAGLLGDLVQDPEKNQLFLDNFNISNFKTQANVDHEKAKYELSQIESLQPQVLQQVLQIGKPYPEVHPRDNHEIHNDYFLSKLKDPTWYSSRSPEVIQVAWMHVEAHDQILSQQKEDQMKQQRMGQDEAAYRQAIVNSGGPDGDPPSLSLFPSVLENNADELINKMNGNLFTGVQK